MVTAGWVAGVGSHGTDAPRVAWSLGKCCAGRDGRHEEIYRGQAQHAGRMVMVGDYEVGNPCRAEQQRFHSQGCKRVPAKKVNR